MVHRMKQRNTYESRKEGTITIKRTSQRTQSHKHPNNGVNKERCMWRREEEERTKESTEDMKERRNEERRHRTRKSKNGKHGRSPGERETKSSTQAMAASVLTKSKKNEKSSQHRSVHISNHDACTGIEEQLRRKHRTRCQAQVSRVRVLQFGADSLSRRQQCSKHKHNWSHWFGLTGWPAFPGPFLLWAPSFRVLEASKRPFP